MILRGDPEKFEYLGENETRIEVILTHWSVKKTGGRKSRWTVPLRKQ